jgi:hypothetical protein
MVVAMNGLPKVETQWRPRDTMRLMVFDPIERMTEALRRGDAFTPESLRDMQLMQQRLEAFSDALDARLSLLEDN